MNARFLTMLLGSLMLCHGAVAGDPGGPPNDDCANATVVGLGCHPVDFVGSSNDGSASCFFPGDEDVWFRFTAPADDTLQFAVDSTTAVDLAIFEGCSCPPGPQVVCDIFNPSLQLPVTAGTCYTVLLATFTADTATLMIAENEPPVANCKNVTVDADASCMGTATAADVDNGSFDPEGGPLTYVLDPPGPYALGDNPVTLTVTDDAGQSSSCIATITVEDNTPPMITCPATQTGMADGNCNFDVPDYTGLAVVSDACDPSLVITQSPAAGSTFNGVGSTVITLTVSDASGNAMSCTFTLDIQDNTPPTILCPADIVVNNEPGQCGAVVNYNVTPADNCPGFTVAQTTGLASGEFFPRGPTTNTFVVTDASGNTFTCSFQVTVHDTEAPTITCPDLTLQCVADVPPAEPGAVSATDNCPGVVVSLTSETDNGGAGCASSPLIITRTYTATDAPGNTASCTQTITVADTTPPQGECPPDITATTDPGECFATIKIPGLTFTDNCDGTLTVASLRSDAEPLDAPYPVGTTAIYWSSFDSCENMFDCSGGPPGKYSQFITVNDEEDPTITCPADITVNNDPGQCGAVVNYNVTPADNCPGFTVAQTAGLPNGASFPVGTTTNTFVVTDASGNTAECSFDVIVNDTEDPVPACPVSNLLALVDANCNYTYPDLCTAYPVTDNCPGVTCMQTPPPGTVDPGVGTKTAVLTYTDAGGNTAECNLTIIVTDGTDPTITCPADIVGGNDPDECGAVVNYTVTASDNCPGETLVQTDGLASGEFFPVGTTTNSFLVTDAAGNTAQCSFTVTVNDEEDPVILCGDIKIIGECDGLTAVDFGLVVTDNCPDVTVACELEDGTPVESDVTEFEPGEYVITCTATDASGNEAECTFTLTVHEPPKLELVVPESCVMPGDKIVVEVHMRDLMDVGIPVAGFQAFISFDTTKFGFIDGFYPVDPFGLPIGSIIEDPPGVVKLAAGIDPFNQTPTLDDAVVAVLTFTTLTEDCEAQFCFCDDDDSTNCTQESALTDTSGEAIPGLCTYCSNEFTVDGTAPRFNACCGDLELDADANCLAWAPNLTGCAEAVDECDSVMKAPCIITQSPAPGTPLPLGETVITLTATDCAGNSSDCQVSVLVVDTTAPTCLPPVGILLKADNDCTVIVPEMVPLIDDNCDNPSLLSIVQDPAPGSILTGPLGDDGAAKHIVTLTITDDAGNSTECTSSILIVDNAPPKIAVCPNDFDAPASCTVGLSDCNYLIPDLTTNIVAVDNCALPPQLIITQSPAAGTVTSGLGVQPVVITVTDLQGNSDQCTVNINVIDIEAPVLGCPTDFELVLNDECKVDVPDVVAMSQWYDCCSGVTVTQSQPAGSRFLGQGTHVITVTAVDAAGNIATCDVTITTIDESDPVIVQCPDPIGSPGDENCEAVVPQMYGSLIATDNCTAVADLIITQDPLPGTVVGIGDHDVTITVTDSKGLQTSCTTTFTVLDLEAPVIECPANIVVECTSTQGTLVAWSVLGSDNCSDLDITCAEIGGDGLPIRDVDPQGTLFDPGRHFIQCTAMDDEGLTDVCTFTISVIDTTPPFINCQPDLELSADANCQAILPDLGDTNSDNCGEIVITQNPPAGTTLIGQGTTLVTITATDLAGNASDCKVEVTVVDDTPPVFERCSNNLEIGVNERCLGEVPNLLVGVIVSDNCGDVTVTQDPEPGTELSLGTHTVTFTAVDEKGNEDTCTIALAVADDQDPKIYLCPDDRELKVDESCQVELPDLRSEVIADDNCSDIIDGCFNGDGINISQDPAPGSTLSVGVHTVVITVADCAGNIDQCEVTVTVLDNTLPTIDCVGLLEFAAGENECEVFATPPTPKVDDNCDVASLVGKRSDGLQLDDAYPLGKTVVTWTVIDTSGNEAICETSVDVIDDLDPVLTCPDNIEVNADPSECYALLDPGFASARDNCDDNVTITWERSDGLQLDDPYPAGGGGGGLAGGCTTITWVATDNAGNSVVCEQSVCVSDENTLLIDIDLVGVTEPELVRCIDIIALDCDAEMGWSSTVQMTFINGRARNVEVKLPCGFKWTCIGVKDLQHTLGSIDDTIDTVGNRAFSVDFTIDTDNGLVGGDLNQDEVIDIFDFGIWVGQFLDTRENACLDENAGGEPNADISGNGFVFIEDFTFISSNFRTFGPELCCDFEPDGPPPAVFGGLPRIENGKTAAVTSITVAELIAMGLEDLAIADLTGDGVVDVNDMDFVANGGEIDGDDDDTIASYTGNGSWFEAGNWNGNAVPNADTDIMLSDANVTIDAAGAVANVLTLNSNATLTLNAGSLDATNIVALAGSTLVLNDAAALLSIDDLTIQPGASLIWNAGEIEVVGGTLTIEGGSLAFGTADTATLRLSDGTVIADAMLVGEFGMLIGDGVIATSVLNSGIIVPGTMSILGNLLHSETGELRIHEASQLEVVGEATLDGRLEVRIADGVVLTAGAVSGEFSGLQLPAKATVLYEAGSVRIVPEGIVR